MCGVVFVYMLVCMLVLLVVLMLLLRVDVNCINMMDCNCEVVVCILATVPLRMTLMCVL